MKGISPVKLGETKADSPTLGTKVKPGAFTVGNPPTKGFDEFCSGVAEKIKGIGSAELECIAKDQTECIVKGACVNGNSEGATGGEDDQNEEGKAKEYMSENAKPIQVFENMSQPTPEAGIGLSVLKTVKSDYTNYEETKAGVVGNKPV
ncbi:hypothetical protein U1Q18_007661 [Sarracenia purpurea var. burkii]